MLLCEFGRRVIPHRHQHVLRVVAVIVLPHELRMLLQLKGSNSFMALSPERQSSDIVADIEIKQDQSDTTIHMQGPYLLYYRYTYEIGMHIHTHKHNVHKDERRRHS